MRASRFTKALVAGLVVAVFGASQVLADDPQAKQLPQTPNYQTTPQHAAMPAQARRKRSGIGNPNAPLEKSRGSQH